MPGQTTDQQDNDGTPATDDAQGTPSLSLSSDLVRNSPEYRELQRQVRESARAKGRAEQDAAAARSESENVRQAAEAQRQALLADQMASILGEAGVEAFNAIADLSTVDPVEAARKFRELIAQSAQSAGQGSPMDNGPAANGGTPVPAQQQQTPPPPSAGMTSDAPLGQPTTGVDWDAIAKGSTDRYAEIVARNQDPVTRSRVTDRERGEGFMSWLAASYVKGMKSVGRLPRT
jgi:hypothetical protein